MNVFLCRRRLHHIGFARQRHLWTCCYTCGSLSALVAGRGWLECTNSSMILRREIIPSLTVMSLASVTLLAICSVTIIICSVWEEIWPKKLKRLLSRLEAHVGDVTSHVKSEYDWPSKPGALSECVSMAARRACAPTDPPWGGFGPGHRYILFVGLPVTLYVSDCPHLYQLVRDVF